LSFTIAGRKTVSNWAKIVTLAAHDAALVKTWKATNVWVNGVAKPVSYLTGDTIKWTSFARRFAGAGTTQTFLLQSNLDFEVPLSASQNWVSGGGTLKYGSNNYARAIYTIASGQLTTWELDSAGNTVKILFKAYGAAGGHDARFLGTWHPVSGTLDGKPASVASIFGWETPKETNETWTFYADGTEQEAAFAGSTQYAGWIQPWSTSGTTMTWYAHSGNIVFKYAFTSTSSVKWSGTVSGHAFTAVVNSGP
jgi:hypothetical protein